MLFNKNELLSLASMSRQSAVVLNDVVESLQVTDSERDSVQRSCQSLGAWLLREASTIRAREPIVYLQGSFALGLAIRPMIETDRIDADLVCLVAHSKRQESQARLKELVGEEVCSYAASKSMQPPSEGRRCWTLNYADSARFHLDCLPATPDVDEARGRRESQQLGQDYVETSIAITDKTDSDFERITDHWPLSNPKGYAAWFHTRMQLAFESRRDGIAIRERADPTKIPHYRVRTPLQEAIQLFKRHRDIMFADRGDDKPVSIILTTLAAHAYGNETSLPATLQSVLSKMPLFIERGRDGEDVIANPSNPAENFADRLQDHPERRDAFFSWHAQACQDFARLGQLRDPEELAEFVRSRFGKNALRSASTPQRTPSWAGRSPWSFGWPSHRKPASWPVDGIGSVFVDSAEVRRNGFRHTRYRSGEAALPKNASLAFEARTNVPRPFDVFWQVVNTGEDAERAGGLRGGFDRGYVDRDQLSRKESTLYRGLHTIECFIVKSGYLVARSGPFEVRIA